MNLKHDENKLIISCINKHCGDQFMHIGNILKRSSSVFSCAEK